MEDLLRRYVEALDDGRFPEYSRIKALLRTLNSAQENDGVFRELRESFRGRYELLDGVFRSHRNLANKLVRDPIEDERRLDIRNNRDWYTSETRDRDVSAEERQATELISAVEIIYYLIYKSRVAAREFPNLLAMEHSSIFGLAKLICPFTDDFKILEIYLDNSDNRDLLFNEMIDYQRTLLTTRERYTRTEMRNFRRLILDRISARMIQENIQYIEDYFRGDYGMAGNLKNLFNSMILVGQVCKDLNKLGQRIDLRQIDLSLFHSRVGKRNEPYILSKIEGVIKWGANPMNADPPAVNDHNRPTFEQIFENSLKALKFSLPILKYVIKNGLDSYDRALLREQVDRILNQRNQEFLEDFRRNNPEDHAKLLEYLDAI